MLSILMTVSLILPCAWYRVCRVGGCCSAHVDAKLTFAAVSEKKNGPIMSSFKIPVYVFKQFWIADPTSASVPRGGARCAVPIQKYIYTFALPIDTAYRTPCDEA